MSKTRSLRDPLAWAFVAAAVAVGVALTLSYLGAFLDPVGNARDLPVTVVNEDVGAALGNRQVNLGRQAVAALVSPSSPLGDAVEWTRLAGRREAVERLRENKAFAAVVIPSDYSQRLTALALPATGVTARAEVEVLTNPGAGSFARSATEELATRAVMSVSMGLADV